MWYICLDKTTGEIKRIMELSSAEKASAISKYDMVLVDENDVKDKQPHEIKYEDGQVIATTEQEQTTILEAQATKQANRQTVDALESKETLKARVLDALGLTETDLENIKNL